MQALLRGQRPQWNDRYNAPKDGTAAERDAAEREANLSLVPNSGNRQQGGMYGARGKKMNVEAALGTFDADYKTSKRL